MGRWGRWALAGLAVAGLAGCGGERSSEEARSAETRALMGRIFEGLQVALHESVGEEPFSDPARQADVAVALSLLADNAERLERHARDEDAQERFLARSVARDARDLQREHAAGRFDRAAFLIRQMTEDCVACHARLPDSKERPLAEGFVASDTLAALPIEDRVALQMATRRFDDALAALEGQLAGPDHPALMIGPLTDYLVVSIRVRDDYERPIPVLSRFAARDDLWTTLRRDVEYWIASLPALRARTRGVAELSVARAIVLEARALDPFPHSHRSLAHYVAASAVLERWLQSRAGSDAEKAEAFYLRGLIEAQIGRNYWVTAAPFLLETAIRTAPAEPFAEDAYALLEWETLIAYEGADGEIPPEDRERLAALRKLIDAAKD